MPDREVRDDDLVSLCEGEFVVLKAAFSLQGGASMKVSDLRSYTSSELMDHVMKHNGPDGLFFLGLTPPTCARCCATI
jgi:hypothetical protein